MKILLLGGGGREHALAWKIAQSEKCEKLFIAPGNAGTQNVGENVNIKADDFEALKNFAVENGVDMVLVGPEDPLVKGVYDDFKADPRTQNFYGLHFRVLYVFDMYHGWQSLLCCVSEINWLTWCCCCYCW